MPGVERIEMATRICFIFGILVILDVGLSQGRVFWLDAINPDVAMPEGEKLLLRCQRNPGDEIEWYKDDEALRSTTRIHVTKQFVKFKYVNVNDTGVYGCRLESKETVEWRNVTVRIEYPAVRILQNDGFQNEAEETSDLPETRSLHLDSEKMDTDLDEKGESDVEGEHNNTVPESPPAFNKTDEMHALAWKPAGSTMRLRCPSTGNPRPNITWLKNNEEPKRDLGTTIRTKWTLRLEDLVTKDSGNYTCVVCNHLGCINHTFKVDIIERFPHKPYINEDFPKNVTALVNSTATFRCPFVSDLEPYIKWVKVAEYPSDQEDSPKGTPLQAGMETGNPEELKLYNVTEKDEGWYTCIAQNNIGETFSSAYLRVVKSDISSTPGIVIKHYLSSTVSLVAIVTVICICYFYYLYRQRKKSNEQVLFPIMTDIELAILHEIPNSNIQFNTLYSPMLQYNSNEYVLIKIKREEIKLGKLLGSGAFGKVFQGTVRNLERPGIVIPAAIKMLRKNASSQEKKKFLEEAKLMNHFRHKHILRLLAVCLDEDSPLIVLELMEIGLLQYLRDSRNLQPSDSHALRLQDLFAMCEDVARGCCYLENLHFVHRDLACRNCLVSARDRENRVIKIGDFGLAKDVYKDDYYRKKGQGLLPICWMAPESLVLGIFTSQSDVWSFGVVMWEITSLGEHPYIGRTNLEVIDYVRAGGKLLMPLNCPPTLYELMLCCWSATKDRPNFKLCLENIIALRNNIEDTSLSLVDII